MVIYFSFAGWLQRFIHRSDPVPFGSRERRERRGPASPPQHSEQGSGLSHRCGLLLAPCTLRAACGCDDDVVGPSRCAVGLALAVGLLAACDSPHHRPGSAPARTEIETTTPSIAAVDGTTSQPSRPATVSAGPSTSQAPGGPAVASITGHVLAVAVDSTGRPAVDAIVFDVDAFETPPMLIADLRRQGRKTICYLDVGSWEP